MYRIVDFMSAVYLQCNSTLVSCTANSFKINAVVMDSTHHIADVLFNIVGTTTYCHIHP